MRHEVLDVDGDGREELVTRRWLDDGIDQAVINIESDGALVVRSTNLPKRHPLADAPTKVLDINGDGLVDLMEGDVGGMALLLSRGDGNFSSHVIQVPDLGWRPPLNTNTMGVRPWGPYGCERGRATGPGRSRQSELDVVEVDRHRLRTRAVSRAGTSRSRHGRLWDETPVLADLDGDSFLDLRSRQMTRSPGSKCGSAGRRKRSSWPRPTRSVRGWRSSTCRSGTATASSRRARPRVPFP